MFIFAKNGAAPSIFPEIYSRAALLICTAAGMVRSWCYIRRSCAYSIKKTGRFFAVYRAYPLVGYCRYNNKIVWQIYTKIRFKKERNICRNSLNGIGGEGVPSGLHVSLGTMGMAFPNDTVVTFPHVGQKFVSQESRVATFLFDKHCCQF